MATILTRPIADDAPAPPTTGVHRRRPDRPVTASGVLRSEWVKLRSLRSSTLTLLAASTSMLLIGALAAAFNSGLLGGAAADGDGGPAGGDPTGTVLAGSLIAPLIIGVLGVMLITSEYATGTIRNTMTLVPKRLPVLWAKIAVLAAVTVPVMVITTVATFFTGQLLLGAGDAATAGIGDPGVLRAVLGTAGYLGGVALMGLAAGVLLRGTAAAVSALFALVFLLPGLGGLLLPADLQEVLLYLPSNAASSFTSVAPGPDVLATGTGAAVFAAWVVVPLLLAAVALKRRAV